MTTTPSEPDPPDPVQQAINALGATPEGHPLRPGRMVHLADTLRHRYTRDGDPTDLDQAITHYQDAVDATPSSDTNRLGLLNNLANALRIRYIRNPNPADLNLAITCYQEALTAIPPGHKDQAAVLNNLAAALMDRYALDGDPTDLDQAITQCQHAVDATPPGNTNRPARLNTLATALLVRYDRDGDPTDLDQAISLFQATVDATPPGNTNRPAGLTNLANALRDRYKRDGDLTDLDQAIHQSQHAVDTAPPRHPSRPKGLSSLAIALRTRYARDRDPADLNAAIIHFQEAFAATPPGSTDRPGLVNNLGRALQTRYTRDSDPTDLDQAISLYQDALSAMAPGAIHRQTLLNNLATALTARYTRNGRSEDVVGAAGLVLGVLTGGGVSMGQAARAGQVLVMLLRSLDTSTDADLLHPLLAKAFPQSPIPFTRPVSAWIPVVISTVLDRADRVGASLSTGSWLAALGRIQGLAADGAYQAAVDDDLAGAARLVERGCAVIAGARQSQQDAVLDLLTAAGHDSSVAAYRDAVAAVTNQTATPAPDPDRLATLLTTLTDARALLESLWGAPLAPQATPDQITCDTTTHGPVTYLIATPDGGLALTLTPPTRTSDQDSLNYAPEDPRVQATWLPEFTSTATTSWVETLTTPPPDTHGDDSRPDVRSPIRGATVWRKASTTPTPSPTTDTVVEDLIHALQPLADAGIALTGPAGVARVVPVGPLAQLPLTPALSSVLTPPDAATTVGIALAGSAKLHILATTPRTLTRLGHTPQNTTNPPAESSTSQRVVAVTNPRTCTWAGHDQPALPAATREGDHLHKRYAATHHTHEHATREALLAAFTDPTVTAIHLALHGDTPPWAPDTAHLLLADQPTTDTNNEDPMASAGTVTAADLPALLHHDLIFLNSCWTGKPGTTLPDEAQSLPTALITAGAHTVIAPLWPVADDAAAHLTTVFYNAWQNQGHPPPTALAIAAHNTRHHAYTLHADGQLTTEELHTWTTTTHAYTCTGTGICTHTTVHAPGHGES